MKKLIVIFTLLLVSNIFGQKKSIHIQYAVKINDEKELFSNDKSLRGFFDQAITGSEKLLFGLIIDNSASKFYLQEGMTTAGDHNLMDVSLIFSSYTGMVFQFGNSIFRESSSLGNGMMVKEPLKANWELHNETKMIDNYLCYKATSTNDIDNGQGKIFKHPIVAWYCPKLPYNYGPNGYSNLPGLILELQVRNVVFGVKKIDLNSNLDFDTKFLQTIKTISLEELNRKLQEEAENFKG